MDFTKAFLEVKCLTCYYRLQVYNKVTGDFIGQLKTIVGGENILLPNDDIEPYSHDFTEDFRFYPEVVVKPASTKDVSAIMKLCNERMIPVTPRAGRD